MEIESKTMKAASGRSVACLVIAVLLSGCSDHSPSEPVIVDRAFSLIRHAEIGSVSPERFVPGSDLAIELVVDSRYAGLANIGVVGWYQNLDVGRMLEPVEGELGGVSFALPVQPGTNTVNFRIAMSLDKPLAAFTFYVSIDSLEVGGGLVHWESSAGYSVFGGDIPPDTAFIFNSVDWTTKVDRDDDQGAPCARIRS